MRGALKVNPLAGRSRETNKVAHRVMRYLRVMGA